MEDFWENTEHPSVSTTPKKRSKRAFLSNKSECDSNAIAFVKTRMKVTYSEEHYPRYVSAGKRPYVSWYAYDIYSQKFVNRRKETKFLHVAEELMQIVKQRQMHGDVIDLTPKVPPVRTFTICEAIEKYLADKAHLKKKTVNSYHSRAHVFLGWVRDVAKIDTIAIDKFTPEHAKSYLQWAKKELKNQNGEINNKREYLKNLFQHLINETKIITENPIKNVKRLKELEKRRATFSTEHLRAMWLYFREHDKELYFASKFIFYAFIRPDELRNLKISDIDLRAKKLVVRDGKGGLGYIEITPPLWDLIAEMELSARAANELVFQNTKGQKIYENRWGKVFLAYRIKHKLPDEYVFYCFKHTGVREHFLAGNNLLWIKKQCRHKELATTLIYLQTGLGLDTDNGYNYIPPLI